MNDLAVIGSGPAGWAVAWAAAAEGLKVVCISPEPTAPWPNNYGMWLDELHAAGLEGCAQAVWPKARVRLDASRTKVFDRPYARIDNEGLRNALRGPHPMQLEAGRVQDIEHTARASRLVLEDGRQLQARVVIDASGADSRWTQRPAEATTAAQVAYGQTVHAPNHGLPVDEMLLMDFSEPGTATGTPVTFLYAMPQGPDRVFVEETVLVGRPPASMDHMKDALQARLSGLGIEVRAVLDEERCVIPMGGPLPQGSQRVVPLGAAAGMVHPATGYTLNRVLTVAPALASAIARGLRAVPADPQVAADLGWQVVWPEGRRRAWALYRFGMDVLLEMDRTQTQRFFAAFFEVRPEAWAAYLSGTATVPQMMGTMAQVFAQAPWATRRRLVGGVMGRSGLDLLAALGD